MEQRHDTAQVAKNLRLDNSRDLKGKQTTIILLREHSNKMVSNDFLLCSAIIREDPFRNIKKIKRLDSVYRVRDLGTQS